MLSAIKGEGPEGGEAGEQFRERVRQFVNDLGRRVPKLEGRTLQQFW